MEQALQTKDDRKAVIIEKLSTAYSLNHVSLEEYERLVQYSHSIETDKELKTLEKIIDESYPSAAESGETVISVNGSEKNYFTLLSSRKTPGSALNGNSASFTCILGEHQINIDEDDLIKGETVLDVMVILGNIVVFVPENVNVICDVMPVLADISMKNNVKNKKGNKNLAIKGKVILGNIKITRN
jgi:predicted membrane protein